MMDPGTAPSSISGDQHMTDGTSPGRRSRRAGWRGPGITVGQVQKLGIGPNSPRFQTARRACLKPLAGVLP
jgi:hypothetical protein